MPIVIDVPVQSPVKPIFTFADLVGEVVSKVEGRITDTNKCLAFLRDALLELSGNTDLGDEFDELQVKSPLFSLTGGQKEYDFKDILDPGVYNEGTLSVFLWRDYPFNTDGISLDGPIDYKWADNYGSNSGTPTQWYRFGDTLGFDLTPDKPYQIQLRLLKMHPVNDSDLAKTVILLPRSWNEVLVMSAAYRGFIDLGEYEKAAFIHSALFGDPKHPDRPGLIKSKIKRRQREAWRKERSLMPVVRRMTR